MLATIKGQFIKNDKKNFDGKTTNYALILVDDEIARVKNCYFKDAQPLSNVTVDVNISVYNDKLYTSLAV